MPGSTRVSGSPLNSPLPVSSNLPANSNSNKGSGQTVFNGNEALATSYTKTACGLNYVQASHPLHQRVFAQSGVGIGVTQPAAFFISGIPTCAVIEKAFLYVGTSGAGNPITASITNPSLGNSIFPMTLIGTAADKCWSYAGSYSYRADVTTAISGNGSYIISGIPVYPSADDADGATLFIIYSDRTQNYTGSIVLADGAQESGGNYVSSNISGFNVCGPTLLTRNLMLVTDLQTFDDVYAYLNSTTTNYTELQANQHDWNYIDATGAPAYSGQNNADYGLDAYSGGDCFSLVMAGMYYRTGCLTCPAPMNLAITNPSCAIGSATVSPSGGLTPYNYSWSGSAQTTSAVTNLSPGTHTVTVGDALSCKISTTTINVTIPTTVVVNNGTVCIGYSTTLTAGPTANYTWSPGANLDVVNSATVVANPLTTTIYTIVTTNSMNCLYTTTAQLLVVPQQTVTINSPTTCVGQDIDLLANVTYTGTTYTWQGPVAGIPSVQNPTITNATVAMSGNYSLTVFSAPGCTSHAVASVTVFPLPSPTITSNAPICTNNTLNLNGSGAVNYNWQGPNSFVSLSQNPSIVNANTSNTGIYTLTAAFANGCAQSTTFSVTVKPLPATSIGFNAPVCLNTTLALSGSGGTSYAWTGPNGFSSSVQNPSVTNVTALASGIYTLIATLSSCTAAATQSVFINPLPVPTATNNAPVCGNSSLQLSGTGGVGYSWTGPALFASAVQNPSIAATTLANDGIYTLTVTDANNCKASKQTTVVILPNPLIVATGTNACLYAPATLTIGGGLTYTWTGPGGFTSNLGTPTIAVTDPNSAGFYTVIVTGANTCTSSATASLGIVIPPIVSALAYSTCLNEQTVLTAYGASTYTWSGPSGYSSVGQNATVPLTNSSSIGTYSIIGMALTGCTNTAVTNLYTLALPAVSSSSFGVCLKEPAVLTSTVTPVLSYSWTGPGGYSASTSSAGIAMANNVAVTLYTIMGMAPNGCTASATASLYTYPLPTVTATGTLICLREPFTLLASGADTYTWSGPNNYSASSPNPAFVPIVNNLSAGNYSVVGTTAIHGCTNSATARIDTLSLPIITTVGSTVCIGNPAVLQANGGISYSWSGPGSYTANTQNAIIPVTSNVSPQNFTVVGTAPNSCTNSSIATLATFPLPKPTFTGPSRICFKSTIVLEGFGAKTYTWTGPFDYYYVNKKVEIPVYDMDQEGTYTLSVTDSLGCKSNTTIAIKIDPLPDGILVSDNANNYCVPFCSTFSLSSTGASSIINTSWIVNNRIITGSTFSICIYRPEDNVVVGNFTDANGCVNIVNKAIKANPSPIADFNYSPGKPIENLDEVFFTDNSKGDKLVQWDWFFVNNKGFVSSQKNTSYLFDLSGSYPVAMVVTNSFGCSDTAVKTIIVGGDYKLYVPNAFTPNGDGINETFQPKGSGVQKYTLAIYDRWGNHIFQSNSFENGWDGTVGGKHCAEDVYIWKVFIVDINGQIKDMTGYVTLVR